MALDRDANGYIMGQNHSGLAIVDPEPKSFSK